MRQGQFPAPPPDLAGAWLTSSAKRTSGGIPTAGRGGDGQGVCRTPTFQMDSFATNCGRNRDHLRADSWPPTGSIQGRREGPTSSSEALLHNARLERAMEVAVSGAEPSTDKVLMQFAAEMKRLQTRIGTWADVAARVDELIQQDPPSPLGGDASQSGSPRCKTPEPLQSSSASGGPQPHARSDIWLARPDLPLPRSMTCWSTGSGYRNGAVPSATMTVAG